MNHFLSGGEISADSLINTIILASFEMAPHKTYLIVTDSPFIETFLLFTIYGISNQIRTYDNDILLVSFADITATGWPCV